MNFGREPISCWLHGIAIPVELTSVTRGGRRSPSPKKKNLNRYYISGGSREGSLAEIA